MSKATPTLDKLRVAIVCDWIMDMGGAELVLAHLLELFPDADIYTSVFFQQDNPIFADRNIYTSFLQKIPFINRRPKIVPFLRPYAFESFDFTGYDLVISSSSAEAKGIITKPETLHICYCHTPTRYFWSHYHEYRDMLEFGILNPLARIMMPLMIHRLRLWDYSAAQRVDHFIANSENTANRIKKYYGRESTVIYPGIDPAWGEDLPNTHTKSSEDPYYIAVGRIIPYKRFDLLIDTFNQNQKHLVIITSTDNRLSQELRARSGPNIEWHIRASNEKKSTLLKNAQAFLFPQEEDLGLAPIEAMACGTPVIAYKKGGAIETIIEDQTGVFFLEQTVESLQEAIERLESMRFDEEEIVKHANRFEKRVFQEKIRTHITALLIPR